MAATSKDTELSLDVLRTLWEVDRILLREREPDRMLQKVCDLLVTTRSYANVWIAALDEQQLVTRQAEAGADGAHRDMVDSARPRRVPPCARRAISSGELVVTSDHTDCSACRRSCEEAGAWIVSAPLSSKGVTLGAFVALVPEACTSDLRERWLIDEIITDLSEGLSRHQLEEQRLEAVAILRESDELYRAIVETSPDAITVTDLKGVFIAANESAARMHGAASVEQFLATAPNAFDLIVPEERSRAMENMRNTLETGTCRSLEYTLRRRDGSTFSAEMNSSVLVDAEGRPKGFVGIVRDISERRKAEAEKAAMEAQLRHQQKLESLGTLASGVAHEINTPVNVVMNYAELALQEVGPQSRVVEYAQEILSESQRIADIVRSLLAFARLDAASRVPTSLSEIVEHTLSLVGKVLAKDNIEVVVDVPASLSDVVCRRQQIQQVLTNLLTNARDALNERFPEHHPDKRVAIIVKELSGEGQRWVRTTVEDQGVGIAPEIIDRVFDPFFTSKHTETGTGLGLAVSHGIVADHGGHLRVESTLDEGTRFHLDLPVSE